MAMKSIALALAGVAAGCSSGEGVKASVDAAHGTHNDAPLPPNGTALDHTLFLNTEGVELHMGADDATLNISSVIQTAATADAFVPTAADRETQIAAIVGELQTILSPYDISVVTVRPATGPYHQMVLTSSAPPKFGLPQGLSAVAPSPTACMPKTSEIGLVFATGSDQHFLVENIIGDFGIVSLIPLVTTAGDCMCFASATCTALTAACTIGGATTALDTANDHCHGAGPTVDEAAVWLSTFGAYR